MADGPGFRTFTTTLAHRPLKGTYGERLLYVLGLMQDDTMQKLTEGVKDHMCTECDFSALQFLGSERGITKGLFESDSSYAQRLQRALDDLRLAGAAWSVLAQTLGYVLDYHPRALTVETVYTSAGLADSSIWDYYGNPSDITTSPTHLEDTAGGWNWDQFTPGSQSWAVFTSATVKRWYLVLGCDATNPWISLACLWSNGGTWGSGLAWGTSEDNLKGLSVKIITKQFKPLGPLCDWIIVAQNDAEFVAGSPEGGGVNPDGYFGRWAKLSGGVYVRSRFSDARYFKGPTYP